MTWITSKTPRPAARRSPAARIQPLQHTPADTAPTGTPVPRTGVGAVVGFLICVELASGFIQGFYLPLFKAIADHFHVSDSQITWFSTVQTVAAAVCVPILAKLGDTFGHRKILRLGVVLVLCGTLLTALAPTYPVALAGRVLLGALAVWLPLEIGIVHARVTGESGRRAVGMLAASLTAGIVLGSLAGGLFGSATPISLALFVPPAVIVVCTVLVFTVIPDSVRARVMNDAGNGPLRRTRLDILGFVLLAVAMLATLFGLFNAQSHGFARPGTLGLLALGTLLFVVFVLWELRAADPAINVRVVASRPLWPAYATSFLFGIALFGTQTITTTFLAANPHASGYGFSFAPGIISLFSAGSFLLGAIGASTFAPIAARTSMRTLLVIAVLLCAASNLTLTLAYVSLPVVICALVVSGLGTGLLLGALPALIAERSPAGETGTATGLYNTLKTLGGALAGAVFAVVLAAFTQAGSKTASAGGYQSVWVICAAGFVLAAIILIAVPAKRGSAAP